MPHKHKQPRAPAEPQSYSIYRHPHHRDRTPLVRTTILIRQHGVQPAVVYSSTGAYLFLLHSQRSRASPTWTADIIFHAKNISNINFVCARRQVSTFPICAKKLTPNCLATPPPLHPPSRGTSPSATAHAPCPCVCILRRSR